jgi:hypothetical protein
MKGPNQHPSTNGPSASTRRRRRAGTFTNTLSAATATSPAVFAIDIEPMDARVIDAIMKELPPLE